MDSTPLDIGIDIAGVGAVSGLWQSPPGASACLALAHGAGAGMRHAAMAAIANGLSGLGVSTLRYQFPYMEAGGRRPDAPSVAQATVRAAVAEAGRRAADLPLFAGGRSFGGRMTSQAQALNPMPGVKGLIFFAFPLHPAGKPATARAEHLSDIAIPMLFLQGSKDALATLERLQPTVAGLGERATLHLIRGADHAFHVPVRSGVTDAEALASALATAVAWMAQIAGGSPDGAL